MYITVEDFCKYNNLTADEDAEAVIEKQINYAEEIVDGYLGYSAEKKNYVFSGRGSGSYYLKLNVWIDALSAVKINGIEKDKALFGIEKDTVFFLDGRTDFSSYDTYEVTFSGGFSKLPAVITGACQEIASLLYTETNQNIGMTAKALPGDMGSYSFIKNTNFDAYLARMDKYRILIISPYVAPVEVIPEGAP